jgi:glutathione S-transferase
VLYVREGCRFCASVLRAAQNLHCTNLFHVRDVEKDPNARRDLDAVAGEGAKVPTLVEGGKVMQESGDIIRYLAEMYARA